MSGRAENQLSVSHPRETAELYGHREAETALLNAYRGGRIPHAWLIGGAQGIGKATLAYRMARFVLDDSGEAARKQFAPARNAAAAITDCMQGEVIRDFYPTFHFYSLLRVLRQPGFEAIRQVMHDFC